jgi:MFS family permease
MPHRLIPPGWRVLERRDFRRLWLAHAGSVVGDGFHAIAITWLLLDTLGGGPQALAVFGIANLLPSLALGILSGTVVDRLDRRRAMIGADLVRAALGVAVAVLLAAGGASVTMVIVLSVALTVAGLFFYPARNSALPRYVAPDELVAANGLMQATTQGSQLLAPLLGGVLFVAVGPVWLLAINAASFVVSAVLIGGITPESGPASAPVRRPLLQEAADGLRFISGHPPSRLCVLTTAANQLFASGPWRILIPTWVAVWLGGGAAEYGVLMSAFAAGLVVSSVAMTAVRASLPLMTLIPAGVFIDGALEVVFAYSPSLAFASVALFLMGISNAVLNASLSTVLQLSVPSEMRGRAFATFSTGGQLTTPVSLAVTGALAGVASPTLLLVGAGAGLMLVGALSFIESMRIRQPAPSTAEA